MSSPRTLSLLLLGAALALRLRAALTAPGAPGRCRPASLPLDAAPPVAFAPTTPEPSAGAMPSTQTSRSPEARRQHPHDDH